MGYRPISAYGVVGNDDRCALVSTDGSIDWCCFPTLADPSVFGRLLDAERGGHFAVQPTGAFDSRQRYLGRTNVLQTTFETAAGRATLTDWMPVGAEERWPGYQRAVCRKLRCVAGEVTVAVDCAPAFDYARADTTVRAAEGHVVAAGGDERVHLQTHGPIDVRPAEGRAVGTAALEAGETAWFVLQHGHWEPAAPSTWQAVLEDTVEYWRDWTADIVDRASFARDEPWFDAVVRSALVLKLLINEGTGAIYAAATTSLPERIGGDRNWDYRYNWIRDAKFTVQALYNLGSREEARDYFEWFRSISHEDPAAIQPAYGVHGERDLSERTLDHLAGYRHSSPVRIGNAAADQRQLDVYGAIVEGLFETLVRDERLDDEDWASVRALVDHVCGVWDEPDRGIWEFRTPPRHYVHSKLLCWVALDRGLELADQHDREAPHERWRAARSAVREAIERRGYRDSIGSFVQHFEADDALDATCLLIPIYGFLPPDDPRVEGTIDTVREELLTDAGLVARTRAELETDGTGAFLLCSFWLVDALVLADRVDEARAVFSSVLDYVSPPYLLSERIDPATGAYLGNFPQAFSHIGLVNSAIYLSSAADSAPLARDPLDEAANARSSSRD